MLSIVLNDFCFFFLLYECSVFGNMFDKTLLCKVTITFKSVDKKPKV